MAEATERKKPRKHLQLSKLGGETRVQILRDWVEITIRIPRKRLTQRLAEKNLDYLRRSGLLKD